MQSRGRSVSWPDAVLTGVLFTLILLAWSSLWFWRHSPQGHLLMHGFTYQQMAAESPMRFALIFISAWTLMTISMMMPTSVPLLVLFHRMVRKRTYAAWLVATVVLGYLAVWISSGALLQVLNWTLQAGAARIAWPAAAPWIGSAVVLGIAGLYQFSSLKYACLEKCRSPFSFLAERWQGGNEPLQALQIGLAHGLFCVGCCWSLMLLMFLVSAQSLTAMMVLGAAMALEKNASWGRHLTAPLGVLLLTGAAAALVIGIRA
jgi:predicted metal-binding membrane protein